MRHTFIKTVALGVLALGMTSCADNLNISPIDPQSSSTYDDMSLLAKQYATLGLTGQKGPAGSADLSMDEGESGFYRTVFNLQELCTDEVVWAWQSDTDMSPLTYIQWNRDSSRALWAYNRLAFDVTLFNQFLSDNGERTDGEWPQYVAEVRFLRALHFYYFLDLFHKAPFTLDFGTGEYPVEKGGKELYDWIDQELTEIEPLMASVGSFCNSSNFGRADQGAAYALHARLALNSEVYTDGQTKDYQKAVEYCNKIIESGAYSLSTDSKNGYSGYEQVFMGDNDYNSQAMKEIIFPIRQDGVKTQQYGGATYLVSSIRIAGMPYAGTTNTWSCNFARHSLLKFFFDNPDSDIPYATSDMADEYLKANYGGKSISDLSESEIIAVDNALGGSTSSIVSAAGDDRALLYGGVGGGTRTLSTKQITGFLNGLSIVKWQNRRSDNTSPNNETFSDVDIPLFRLAEIYLTRAEAYYRLGTNTEQAIKDLNMLRSRAHAALATSIDEDMLIKEWGKEFYMEGRRRSDLVRFGLFTTSKYLWDFKGGETNGTSVDKKYNIYPIPATEVSQNANMTQNPGY